MKFIEQYLLAYVNNANISSFPARTLFNTVSLYIVPMVNPDGVNLVTGEFKPNSLPYMQAQEIAKNYTNIPFPAGWKANIKGESLINFHLYCKNKYKLFYICLYFLFLSILVQKKAG